MALYRRTICGLSLKLNAVFVGIVGVCLCVLVGCGEDKAMRVMAAASVAAVIETVGESEGAGFEVDAGASGALARRVELGARGDLFVSADRRWIDRLVREGRADGTTRRVLAQNRLVVVVGPRLEESEWPSSLSDLGGSRFSPLAIGEPGSVAAGGYAKQAIERSAGAEVWDRIVKSAAMAGDVRGVAAYVSLGVCPAGIAYATDVRGIEGGGEVRIGYEIDASLHDPIVIEGVVLTGSRDAEAAAGLLGAMATGAVWRAAWREAGFVLED